MPTSGFAFKEIEVGLAQAEYETLQAAIPDTLTWNSTEGQHSMNLMQLSDPINLANSILFVNNDPVYNNLFLLDLDACIIPDPETYCASSLHQLTDFPTSPARYTFVPRWSPDRTKIAFYYSGPANFNLGSVYVIDSSDNPSAITDMESAIHVSRVDAMYSIAWSPDGDYLAVAGHDNGQGDIYLIDYANYTECDFDDPEDLDCDPVNLTGTGNTYFERGISWSPDGSKLVYASNRNEDSGAVVADATELWIVKADGSDQWQLTETDNDLNLDNFDPDWSPDGQYIAYGHDYDDPNSFDTWSDLWILTLDANGNEIDPDVNPEQVIPTLNYYHQIDSPSWSPDGNKIIYTFQGKVDATTWIDESLFVYDASNPVPNSTQITAVSNRHWSPDWGFPVQIERDVAPEAQAFHDHAREFGLPMPFDSWPVADFASIIWKQGYGPTSFAREAAPPPYHGTHQIHSGIDFTGNGSQLDVVAVCDGVIVTGRTTGLYTGYGLSLRCFADDPNDTDNDGNRNLSNIVVSYNHLDSVGRVPFASSGYTIVYEGQVLGHTQSYYYSQLGFFCAVDAESQDTQSGDCVITDDVSVSTQDNIARGLTCNDSFQDANQGGKNECRVIQEYRYCINSGTDSTAGDCIIYKVQPDGRGEGLTCVDSAEPNECGFPSSNHLHLEVSIARGFNHSTNRIRINPLFMFSRDYVEQFTSSNISPFEPYFPIWYIEGSTTIPFDDQLGLNMGEIDQFSQNGDLGDTDPRRNGFFQIQDTTILGPEWWRTDLSQPPRMIVGLDEFLSTYGYPLNSSQYIGPNCVGLPANTVIDSNIGNVTCNVDWDDIGQEWNPLQPGSWPISTP